MEAVGDIDGLVDRGGVHVVELVDLVVGVVDVEAAAAKGGQEIV